MSHLDDLKYASIKVSELEKEIKEQEWKNHQNINHTTYSVIGYITITVIGLYVLYKLYKWITIRFLTRQRPKAITRSLREIQTSAQTGGSGNIVNINIKTSNESLAVSPEAIPLHSSNRSLQEESSPRRSLRPRAAKSYF